MTTNNLVKYNLIHFATIQGKRYPINTDFKVAVQCDAIINDVQIDDVDRGILITGLLFGENSPYCQEALDKANIFLSGAEESGSSQKRIIDFNQHWDLIYSAFLGQYGINLHKVDMHYQEFVMLLKGVKDTALSDVIDILSRNPNEEKDHKTRKKLIEAQNKLKIKEPKAKVHVNDAFLNELAAHVKGETR